MGYVYKRGDSRSSHRKACLGQGSFALGKSRHRDHRGEIRQRSAAVTFGIVRPFQKGTSGNRGGRPKAAHSIQELARKHTIEALDVLVQIMLNEKAPPNARVAAANTLLDRAYGKAPTFSTSDPKPLNGRST